MIEYAITNGKGKLIDYGVVDKMIYAHQEMVVALRDSHTIHMRPCLVDCETGK